jgi:hypothetical protein
MVWAIAALRDQALQVHIAGGAEEVRADIADLEWIDKDAVRRPRSSRSRFVLRIESGRARRSWPSIASRRRRKAAPPRRAFLNAGVEVGAAIHAPTASPSITNCLCPHVWGRRAGVRESILRW